MRRSTWAFRSTHTLFALAEESNDMDTPFFACVYCDMDDVKK